MDFQVDKVAIYEPRLDFGNGKKPWVITKASELSTYTVYPADSYSNSTLTFSLKPPSKYTVADRVMEIKVPIELRFTGRATPGLADEPLLKGGQDAFRYMPFSSICESIQMKLNGYSISCQLKDIIHPLTRYHADLDFYDGANSIGPNMFDYSQEYHELDGGNNNPLDGYADNVLQVPRGAYPMEVTNLAGDAEQTNTEARVRAVIREFIYMPPCIWNNDQVPGLVGLDNLQFTFNLTNLPHVWSRSHSNGYVAPDYTDRIISLQVSIYEKPQMIVNWLSPPITEAIPRLVQYPYFEITRFQTQTSGGIIGPGETTELKSNQISLNSIPRKIFIYASRPQSQLISGSNVNNDANIDPVYGAIYSTDTYLRINQLQVSWGNQNTVFSGADIINLYQLSCKNGLKMGFVEFYGQASELQSNVNVPFKKIGTIGSVICICPSGDLPLAANESEGMLCQKNLQVTANVTNCLPEVAAGTGGTYNNYINRFNTFSPDLNIICVFDGVLEVYDNSARSYIGVINEDDVVNTPIDHSIDYNVLSRIYGGSALEKFKNLTHKAINVARKGNKFLKDTRAISHGLDAFGKTNLAEKARSYGYGVSGGVLYEKAYGGKKVSKKNLKTRLAKY